MKFLFSILFFIPFISFSQKKDSTDQHNSFMDDPRFDNHSEKQWGITAGINGGKYVTGNLGIAHANSQQGFEIWSLSAIGVNAELIDLKRNAWGFGAEAWFNSYISMGIAVIDYTNFENSRYCIRPMFGTGYGNWRIQYGYNIRLNKNDYKTFNTHMFILNFFIPVIKRSHPELTRSM